MEEQDLIPGNQFGFRQGLGAAQQALNFMQEVKEKTGPRKVAVAALIDVEKAYDKVWREGLQFKMRKLGIPVELVKITRSWLKERKFRVKILQSLSRERNAAEGLPQGSPLSPLLFNIFVIDLPKAITIPKSRVFQFADGYPHCFLTSSTEFGTKFEESGTCPERGECFCVQGLNLELSLRKVERVLKEAGVFAANWNIKINESKTEVVKFTNKFPRQNCISWNNKRVKIQNQVTYLGVTFDSKMKFENHVKRRGALTAERLRKLYPIYCRESRLSLEMRKKIFKVIALPSNNYGEELWACGSEKAKDRVEINVRKFARWIGNFPWFTRNGEIKELFQIEDLRARGLTRRSEAVRRLRNHPCEQIKALAERIP
ncbi:Reverse transcriptase (RNA-dependent DNA polymerase) [Popillia japonica]|uniref:Reverse transcriptase (RNA-dependent DNA polymerase) n=1 Tax=Popillia japonica TaxID=7064 RepID=A0AAW1JWL5_POPJA